MARSESSRLGELQAEGNLGNERVRNSSSDDSFSRRDRSRNNSTSEERWSPSGDSSESREECERTDGSER